MCLLVGDVIMDLDFRHFDALSGLRQGQPDSGAMAMRGLNNKIIINNKIPLLFISTL